MRLVQILAIAIAVLLGLTCRRPAGSQGPTLFQALDARHTGVTFRNDLAETEEFNIIRYLYFYNGGGVAAGDVNNDGLVDLYFTANQGPNKLYLNRGDFQFEDVTESAGVAGTGDWKTGVAMADVNGDGLLDIYVCQVGQYQSLKGRNQLFINNGDGAFSEKAAEYGLDFQGFSTHAAFFDYDGDGDLDLYLLNHSVHAAENYGPASIRERREPLAGDRLYRNDEGKFTDVSQEAGIYGSRIGYGLGLGIADLNGDGLPDIYVANDFHENDYLYYNNGNGAFTEALAASMSHTSNFSMGCDLADFNNDGRPDVFTLDMKPFDEVVLKQSAGADPYNIYKFKLSYGYHYQFPRNMLQLNLGAGEDKIARFSEIGQMAGIAATDWSWAALSFDMDNDGWKDLFISNGIRRRLNDLDYLNFISNEQIQRNASDLEMATRMPDGAVTNFAFRNNADLTFSDVSSQWGLDLKGYSNGAAYADLDNDGDLDLVVNNLDAQASIFRNRTNEAGDRRYLALKLRGDGANTQGIGARVILAAGGQLQMQEHYTSRGFQSSVAPGLHFGLGNVEKWDSLLVIWPDRRFQVLRPLNPDPTLTLRQAEAIAGAVPDWYSRPRPDVQFREVAGGYGLDFEHRENEASDFDREKLIPLMTSTPGPRLAAGDMDGDGLEDIFACGAHRQPGALYRQLKTGSFQRVASPAIEQDSLYEDAAAVWLDADGDGDLDLYVVSGGGEALPGLSEPFQDRLYLNDGKGRFQKAEQALPLIQSSGSCAITLDFDGDGLPDLFVGGFSIPNQYGLAPRSYLLRNTGGKFADVTAQVAPELAEAGMVSAAAWDAGQRTLAIAGKWMPVTLFTFEDGKAVRREIPQSEGWWSAIALIDAGSDGRMDVVAGNWGLNSEFRPSPEEPLHLYVADFDGNGSTDPVMAYYKQGRRYTYFSRDELARQMVGIKKQYTDYESFARAGFDKIFPPKLLRKAVERRAVTFATTLFRNEGNGNYSPMELPAEAQMAPVYAIAVADFDGDGREDIFMAGNFYETQPSIGRMGASQGCILVSDGRGGFAPSANSGFRINGQVRDALWIPAARGRSLLVAARNNESLNVWEKK